MLLEKPVSISSSEIEELQRISLINNLSVCVDFEYRAVPLFLQTKKLIDENILGDIYLVKLDWLMGSRSDPKDSGIGIHWKKKVEELSAL